MVRNMQLSGRDTRAAASWSRRCRWMIVERYDPVNLFELVPKLVADFEPELRELDRLLDDDAILQRIKADMACRAPHSLTRGRHSTPVEVMLRLFVVKRLYQWSYEATEHFVGDSLVLRQFCRLYLQPVPDDTTLIRWAKLIGPEPLTEINHRVVELAKELKQAYSKLLDIAEASRRQAARVRDALQEQGTKQAKCIREQLDHFLPLV